MLIPHSNPDRQYDHRYRQVNEGPPNGADRRAAFEAAQLLLPVVGLPAHGVCHRVLPHLRVQDPVPVAVL